MLPQGVDEMKLMHLCADVSLGVIGIPSAFGVGISERAEP
jgi:hypothetical protein